MRKFRNWLCRLFKIELCRNCGSSILNKSHWIRGWNNWCEQASGDSGTRCFDCGSIHWHQSLNDYKKALPNWCEAYPNSKKDTEEPDKVL